MSHRIATSASRAAVAARSSVSSSSISTGSMSGIRRLATQSSAVLTGVRSISACSSSNLQSSSYPMAASPSRGSGLRPNHYLLYSSCSSRLLASHDTSCVTTSRRAISSTPTLLNDDEASAEPAKDSETKEATEEDDDPCPEWQNPLHHNNPDYQKVLSEDFAPGEEMPIVPLPPFETEENEGKVLASPELHALADEIVRLNMLEVKELVDRIGDHFGFDDDDSGFMGGGGDGGGDGGGEAEEEVVEEKTVFDLKLTGFDAKSKIKVIKEIRGITTLGLKEAKELVEGAPTTVKKDIKKEEAEELKEKLEAVGATIEIV